MEEPTSQIHSETESNVRVQPPLARKPKVREILADNLIAFLIDIIPPLRVILATFVIGIAFLVAESLLFLVIEWTAQDIKQKIPFVSLILEGIQVFSLVGIALFSIISGISNLYTQWKISRRIEERAGLHEK